MFIVGIQVKQALLPATHQLLINQIWFIVCQAPWLWSSSTVHNRLQGCHFTPLLPVYEIFILWNHTLSTIFTSLCNSITCHMIELGSCWKSQDAARLLVCIKTIGKFCISFFVGDLISGIGFTPFCPWHQPLEEIFWLQLLLETRLKSESFETLIGFPAVLVLNLRFKNNKNW